MNPLERERAIYALLKDKEAWKEVPSFPSYEASSHGRIRRKYDPSITRRVGYRQTYLSKIGYPRVTIYHNKKRVTVSVHVLVCEAFHGPRPPFYQAAHLNGIKTDIYPSNLAWVTAKENWAHRRIHGTETAGERSPNAVLTDGKVSSIRSEYKRGIIKQRSLAEKYGVDQSTISKIFLRKAWGHVP